MSPEGHKADCHNKDPKVVHREQIDIFREKVRPLLEKYPRYDTDYSLLRWLHAYKFNYDMAAQQMEWSLNAMDAVGIFDKDLSSVESIHKEVRNITPVAEYFPGGMLGCDKDGNVINMHTVGKVRPRSLVDAERVSRFYIGAIMDCEGCNTLIRAEEAKRGRKLGSIMIVDLSDFSYDLIFQIPATKIYINALLLIQTMFPDTARRLYVVNAPLVVNALIKMVLMALAKETVAKIEILGSNWKDILVERHGAENLTRCCGGTLSDDLLRPGGDVPDSVKKGIRKEHYEADQLKKVRVSARDEICIPFEVEKEGSKLCWYFECSSGDIDFSVVYQNHEVWPCFRISTEFVPEFGEIICKQSGTYEIRFSNKHAIFWSKEIKYIVQIESPTNTHHTF
ncbi:unnamed protein product [Toxocara canis]|nr:unnamed protein product [Toxocara canis]